jgi:hypothetical protein
MQKLLFALAVSSVGVAACSSSSTPSTTLDKDDAKATLIDRNWLDVMPQNKDERLHVYRFVPSMGGGVYQDRTLFKGTFELFSFSVKDDFIHFNLHQTDDKVASRFKIEKVSGPEPFDLKLTISDDPRGPHVYYGMRSERDLDGHLLEQRLADQRH